MINKKGSTYHFPYAISVEYITQLFECASEFIDAEHLTLDLRKTKMIHSSFIGFLIYVKNERKKLNKKLDIHLSREVSKVITQLNLANYFYHSKKSA